MREVVDGLERGRDSPVGEDVVLLALDAERLGERDDARLGGRVVGLAKVAVDLGEMRRPHQPWLS